MHRIIMLDWVASDDLCLLAKIIGRFFAVIYVT